MTEKTAIDQADPSPILNYRKIVGAAAADHDRRSRGDRLWLAPRAGKTPPPRSPERP
jgi:hypothetical protein